jgi:hypothetical protein
VAYVLRGLHPSVGGVNPAAVYSDSPTASRAFALSQ